ncbi:MAG: hypothetical protein LUD17_08910 [Bacteroidales bacterium]|nr:hypothetical protein [Bacteroidales bacterium]
MTQITVTIEDPSKVSTIRKLLQMIEGVTVSFPSKTKKKTKEEIKNLPHVEITPFVASLGAEPIASIPDDKDEIYNYLSKKYK